MSFHQLREDTNNETLINKRISYLQKALGGKVVRLYDGVLDEVNCLQIDDVKIEVECSFEDSDYERSEWTITIKSGDRGLRKHCNNASHAINSIRKFLRDPSYGKTK